MTTMTTQFARRFALTLAVAVLVVAALAAMQLVPVLHATASAVSHGTAYGCPSMDAHCLIAPR